MNLKFKEKNISILNDIIIRFSLLLFVFYDSAMNQLIIKNPNYLLCFSNIITIKLIFIERKVKKERMK